MASICIPILLVLACSYLTVGAPVEAAEGEVGKDIQGQEPVAQVEPAEQPQPSPQPQPSVQVYASTQSPGPKKCAILVGNSYRREEFEPGCQLCWAPPETIKCQSDGQWVDGEACGGDTICKHTARCTTTCVPKPPIVEIVGGSGQETETVGQQPETVGQQPETVGQGVTGSETTPTTESTTTASTTTTTAAPNTVSS